MALTTTTQISAPVNRVAQHKLLRNARANCLYFIGRAEADIMRSHSGSFTAFWRRIENFTPDLTALSELSGTLSLPTRTGQQPSVTDNTATLAKYGKIVFLTEEVDLVNLIGQTAKLVENLGDQAGRTLNRLQRNIMEDNATLLRPGGGSVDTDVTSAITRNVIRSAVNTLQRNDANKFTVQTVGDRNIGTAPIRASFWGLCHPDVEEDIRELAGFRSAETYANQTQLGMGEFGALGGVRFISTSEASIDTASGGTAAGGLRDSTTSGAADLYTTMIFGTDYHGAISLDTNLVKEVYQSGDKIPGVIMYSVPRSASVADPISEVATLSFKTWHAGLLLNATWGRGVRTASNLLE